MANKEEEIKRLIEMIHSKNNDQALEAVTILRSKGWLEDGSLAGMKFAGLRLSNIDLSNANFHKANFSHSVLLDVNLGGAKLYETHFWDSLFLSADLSNANLDMTYLNANFDSSNLQGSSLREARLVGDGFHNANFNGADLRNADLSGAYLEKASFIDANLQGVRFKEANLKKADLSKAYLGGAVFYKTALQETNFTEAYFYETVLNNVDLSTAIGLETIQHRAASSIGIGTLYNSKGRLPKVFLRGCGVDEAYIEQIPSNNHPIRGFLYISYHSKEKVFARRVHNRLQEAGIRCWLDEQQPEQNKFWDERMKTLYVDDVVLLCCSQNFLSENRLIELKISIASSHESELLEERGEKVLSLIPLDLDGYLFTDECAEKNPKTQQIRSRIAGNFKGWEHDNVLFEREIEKVIRALRTDGGKAPPPMSKL